MLLSLDNVGVTVSVGTHRFMNIRMPGAMSDLHYHLRQHVAFGLRVVEISTENEFSIKCLVRH